MVKNCDFGLENAALGLRPRAVFSRPRSQFFTIRTSQPATNTLGFLVWLFKKKVNLDWSKIMSITASRHQNNEKKFT